MAGISDLAVLLRSMRPALHEAPYGYVTVPTGQGVAGTFARIAEDEGDTLIAESAVLAVAGLAPGPLWARISLTVHSDLAAVGLTAAFAQALGDRGISANVVAGFYHDHIFVGWERRHDAVRALQELSHG
jgi:uncharacterized protein